MAEDSVGYPFRDKNGNIITIDSRVTWHSKRYGTALGHISELRIKRSYVYVKDINGEWWKQAVVRTSLKAKALYANQHTAIIRIKPSSVQVVP